MNNQINLPNEFKIKMQLILGDEYNDFISSFNNSASKAVHLNTNYMTNEMFENNFKDNFEKLPFSSNGYKSNIDKIGLTPMFHSGLVYSQDPGAMMPVSALPFDFDNNDVVLDLCASPGGKSSQLAIKLSKSGGILVSNEPVKNRNKILRSNMERMSYLNQSTLCMMPEEIAETFPNTFSFILIDAPCSGEGMFRKYPESINEWSPENVKMCASRQKEIIDSIFPALIPGGYILYSTCTYSPEEDEEIVEYIINKYNCSELKFNSEIHNYATKINNKPGVHFFPHKAYGEGQYMCLLKHNETLYKHPKNYMNNLKKVNKQQMQMIDEALKGNSNLLKLDFCVKNDRVIIPPKATMPYTEIGSTSYGILAGDFEKNRFIPHHQLFKIYGHLFSNKLELSNNTELLNSYLKGFEIFDDTIQNGYGVITYWGIPIGGFKASNNKLKNHYPKGLRNI